ncbi:DUF6775 family putative metallopeptidase [Nitrosopumilus sp.]|uniref:DUF6775 family putative metallopeptidase n=1 Tax=Nitrosopumilus sp. TaxID=2024843 RepID=UPI00247BD512|nr:DUF6775 family putative metallopeptidase [Nitrosopumilus sp.]MCV0431704.1 hypothetical protein [Nitrosopumilus sp.]
MKISKIILYDEPTVPQIQLKKLERIITDTFPVKTEIRKNFFAQHDQTIYEKIASCRIFDLKKPFKTHLPSTYETQMEIQNKDMSNKKEMILYDGFELQKVIKEFIPVDENQDDIFQIIFTNKLTCTFDEGDYRYHARTWIGPNPVIISTTGMIEAPAKPKKYYLDLMTNFNEEKTEEIKEKYKGVFLDYNDSRISEISEGYVLQSIMYYETGDTFCEDKECRLYNAHWQKELIHSQVENKKFCSKHQIKFKELTSQV